MQTSPNPKKIMIKALNFDKIGITSSKTNRCSTYRSSSKTSSTRTGTSNLNNPISARDTPKTNSNIQTVPQKTKLNVNIAPKSTLNLITNKHFQISRNTHQNNNQKPNKFISTTTQHINTGSSRDKNKTTLSSFTLYTNNKSTSSRNTRNNNNLTLSNKFCTSVMNNSNSINPYSQNYRTVVKQCQNNSVLKSSLKKNKLQLRPNAVIACSNSSMSESHTIANECASDNNSNQKVRLVEKKRKFIEKEAENMLYKEQRELLKNIALFNNNTFIKMKLFSLWKQYTTYQKRKYIKYSLKYIVHMYRNYKQSGLIYAINQLKIIDKNIIKWDKENKIINIKEVNKSNIKFVFNEFKKQWTEINKYGNNNFKPNITNTDSYANNKKKSFILKTPLSAFRLKTDGGIDCISADTSNKTLSESKILTMYTRHIRNKLDVIIKNKITSYIFRIEYMYNIKLNNEQHIITPIPSKEDITNYCKSVLNNVHNIKAVNEIIVNIHQSSKGNESILQQYLSFINEIQYNNKKKLTNLPNEKRCKKIIFDFTLLKTHAISTAEKELEQQINILQLKPITISNYKQLPYVNNQLVKLAQIIQIYGINNNSINNKIEHLIKQLKLSLQDLRTKYTYETIMKCIEELKVNNNVIELVELIEIILLKEGVNYTNINDVLFCLDKYLGNKYKSVVLLYNEFVNKGENIDYKQLHVMNMKNEFDSILFALDVNSMNYIENLNRLIQLQHTIKDMTNEKQLYQHNKVDILIKDFVNSYFPPNQRDILLFNYIEKVINNPSYSKMFYIKYIKAFLNGDFEGINASIILKVQEIIYEIYKRKNTNAFLTKMKTHLQNNSSYKALNNLIHKLTEEILCTNENCNVTSNNDIDGESISESDVSQMYNNIQNGKDKVFDKVFLLSKEDVEFLNTTLVKSINNINDVIMKYYSKVNANLSIIISKNKITGIKMHINPNLIEKFYLCTPISLNTLYRKYQASSLLIFFSSLFNQIDSEIEYSLTFYTIQSLSEFSSKSFVSWHSNSISQISINSLNLIFTNELSQLLIHSKNHKKDFELIIDKYKQWLQDKTRLNTNIILTLINHISIIEHLLKKNITEINSFEWLKFIRHLWDQQRKQVIIECGGWTNYQFKHLVPHQRILLSPDTDKLFLFNASCFREKSASIVKIANNRYNNIEGYKSIFEEFCYLFWTEMIEVNVYNTSLKEIKNVMDVATHRKSWIYFENICDLNINVNGVNELVYLSKFMQIIQQEIILNDIKSDKNDKMFCLMGCILIDNNVKFKECSLKSSSRIFNFIKPELSYYVDMFIKYCNNGIDDNKAYIMKLILTNEDSIRQKLGSFYYDFDFFDKLFKHCLLRTSNVNNNSLLDCISIFIIQYSKGIYDNNNEHNIIEENSNLVKHEREKIKNYFIEREIIFTNLHIDLFIYLNDYIYNNGAGYMKKPVISGCGSNYFMNEYVLYKEGISNINIIDYKNKSRFHKKAIMINNNNVNIDYNNKYIKVFNLPLPKEKKLIKHLLNKTISPKTNKNIITITDEFHCVLLEFIQGVIEYKSKNEQPIKIYKNIINIFKWIELLMNVIHTKKIMKIEGIHFLWLIIQAICFVYYLNKDLSLIIRELLTQLLNEEYEKIFFLDHEQFEFVMFDFGNMCFKYTSNEKEYINYCINMLNNINDKHKIKICFSERFTNDNINLFKQIVSQCNECNISYIINNNNFNNNTLYCQIGNEYSNDIDNNNHISNIIKSKFNLTPVELDIILSILTPNYNLTSKDSSVNSISILKLFNIIKQVKPYSSLFIYCPTHINEIFLHFIETIIFPNSICYHNEPSISNCIYFNFISQHLIIKTISEVLHIIVQRQHNARSILLRNSSKIDLYTNNNNNSNSFNQATSSMLALLICDYYTIQSAIEFNEKHSTAINISYCTCLISNLLLTQKDYQFYLILNSLYPLTIHNNISIIIFLLKHNYTFTNQIYSVLFYNKSCSISTITEIHSLICSALVNYKYLITDKNEHINSMQFFINEFNTYYSNRKSSKPNNTSITMHLLEKVHLGLSNHFLFALLLTLEQMSTNFELSQNEKEYVLTYLHKHFIFPNDNSIKFNYDNTSIQSLPAFIKSNGEKLISFYGDNTSSSSDFIELLNASIKTTSKYFYTSNVPKIVKDTDKLLYYLTFIPEQSPSIFKYLITKYLLPLYQINKFTINSFLKTPYSKPITIKADESINITNYLCSLAAYFEIQFFIIRTLCFERRKNNNNNYKYKYIIDDDVSEIIRIAMVKGFWIFISDNINAVSLMKVLYEIEHMKVNNKKAISKNFKLFLDQKLIRSECKEAIENYTLLLNIDNDNVDDLEAAHDVWVNVLEEKLLTESLMDENQNDFLEMNSNDRGSNNKNSMSDISIRTKHHTRTNTDLSTLFDLNILNNLS